MLSKTKLAKVLETDEMGMASDADMTEYQRVKAIFMNQSAPGFWLSLKEGKRWFDAPKYMMSEISGLTRALLFLAVENNFWLTTRYLLSCDFAPEIDAPLCSREYIAGAANATLQISYDIFKEGDPRAPQYFDPTGNHPLHRACELKHLSVVKVLVALGANTNLPNANGDTSLLIACRGGDLDTVTYLVEQDNADVHVANTANGNTAMHYACASGNIGLINFLLSKGANPDTPNQKGQTPFHWACSNDVHMEIVLALLSRCNPSTPTTTGDTPLHFAAIGDEPELVRALVKKVDDINVRGQFGRTPLIFACQTVKPANVRILLEAGADHSLTNGSGETAGHALLGINLNQKFPRTDALHALFEHGYVDVPDKKGNVLLHNACFHEAEPECVQFLLQKRNDANLFNLEGRTPLCEATRLVHSEKTLAAVRLLLDAGADPNLCGLNQPTPLMNLAGQPDRGRDHCTDYQTVMLTARLLVEKGANVNQEIGVTKWCNTALSAAVDAAGLEMVEFLLEKGAKVNPEDINFIFHNANTSNEWKTIKIAHLIIPRVSLSDPIKVRQELVEFAKTMKIYTHYGDRKYKELVTLAEALRIRCLETTHQAFREGIYQALADQVQVKNAFLTMNFSKKIFLIQDYLAKFEKPSMVFYQGLVSICVSELGPNHSLTNIANTLLLLSDLSYDPEAKPQVPVESSEAAVEVVSNRK